MKQTIYIDVLFCLNLFINYFILLAVGKFMNMPTNRLRLVLASSLGAVYSFYILLPSTRSILFTIVKVVMSLTIVVAAFKVAGIKMLLKLFACFYLMNFLFCGVIFMIWHYMSPKGVLVNNGVVYFNIPPMLFLIITVLSYLVIKVINIFIRRPEAKSLFSFIEIDLNGRKVIVNAKVDTGNSLREPFSQIPVAVVEEDYIKDILDENLKNFIRFGSKNAMHSGGLLKNKCRMIPFNAISGEGTLPAFKADKFFILGDNKISKEAYVAVCPNGTFKSHFQAILNPELLGDYH